VSSIYPASFLFTEPSGDAFVRDLCVSYPGQKLIRMDGFSQYLEVVSLFACSLQQVASLILTREEHDLAGWELFL
jgi:hypothetical protein